jgi:hypothetical protein
MSSEGTIGTIVSSIDTHPPNGSIIKDRIRMGLFALEESETVINEEVLSLRV